MTIAVIDYGVGNLRNVYKALEAAGAPARIVTSPDGLEGVAGILLPGVGAFGDAAANLRGAGFVGSSGRRPGSPLRAAIDAGTPLLGICVGMQLLFDESEEMGRHAGLGIIPGRVVRFAADMAGPDGRALKVPQIGWNQLCHPGTDPLLAGVPDGAYAYFVHSYFCAPLDPAAILATTDFGTDYASVVRRGNVWGIQCHPEKSQAVGLQILRNFVAIVANASCADPSTASALRAASAHPSTASALRAASAHPSTADPAGSSAHPSTADPAGSSAHPSTADPAGSSAQDAFEEAV